MLLSSNAAFRAVGAYKSILRTKVNAPYSYTPNYFGVLASASWPPVCAVRKHLSGGHHSAGPTCMSRNVFSWRGRWQTPASFLCLILSYSCQNACRIHPPHTGVPRGRVSSIKLIQRPGLEEVLEWRGRDRELAPGHRRLLTPSCPWKAPGWEPVARAQPWESGVGLRPPGWCNS